MLVSYGLRKYKVRDPSQSRVINLINCVHTSRERPVVAIGVTDIEKWYHWSDLLPCDSKAGANHSTLPRPWAGGFALEHPGGLAKVKNNLTRWTGRQTRWAAGRSCKMDIM